jgi:arabinose-5-phosphate isomerase
MTGDEKTATSLARARRVLRIEAEAARLDDGFARAVDILLRCQGKIVVVGMGKSGLVGAKIAATLASTGTPAFFLHAAEAAHGDLGVVHKADVIVAVSHSGETEEIVGLLPVFRRLGLPIVAITGAPQSRLGRTADVILDSGVTEEACPLGLAPTASTTAQLAMGDALAVALLEARGFTAEDFARIHPAGTLGKRLLTCVEDLMHAGDAVPRVKLNAPATQVLLEMSAKRLGATVVEDDAGALRGVITDGDLRRGLQKFGDLAGRVASDLMTVNPKSVAPDALASRAAHLMETHSISCLLVHDIADPRRIVGMIHVHDLMKAGII